MNDLIIVSIEQQRLQYRQGNTIKMDVAIATAKNGPGELKGSECTPRGWHYIRAKMGGNALVNGVFIGRRPTGEHYSPALRLQFPDRDWILTRILWLSGLEVAKNRLGNVDTMQRYIYIHGCPDEDVMGVSSSHGCVKMRNDEVKKLFEMASVGTQVWITEDVIPDLVPSFQE